MVYTECGLYSVISKHEIYSDDIMFGLENLQHRGRESFGISFVEDEKINIVKKIGLVKPIMGLKHCSSNSWLGHVRYSTSGAKCDGNEMSFMNICQPITYYSPILGAYSIAHNGNIPIHVFTNVAKLYKQFKIRHPIPSDTIILQDLIEHLAFLANKKVKSLTNKTFLDEIWRNVLTSLMNIIPGACCMLIQTPTSLWIFRDRYGLKPLTIKKDVNQVRIASESVAFRDINEIVDVGAGEILKIDNSTLDIETVTRITNNKVKTCAFEHLYFLRPNTVINNLSIENFRVQIGKKLEDQIKKTNSNLLETMKSENAIVCGVPTSGIVYGKGFSQSVGLEYIQFLNKRSDYPWRTFILESNDKRIKACQEKYVLDTKKIENKSIIIVDDSIVRGNTLRYLIKYIKMSTQVRSIHIISGTPPIKHPCLYGVDFPDIEELFANNIQVKDMPKHLDVDSVSYLNIETLHAVKDNICDACFTGKYLF
tara:strand:+ start:3574 stop:5016 length:1443 start_codon:yes stop_codon:yes gene_type:complete